MYVSNSSYNWKIKQKMRYDFRRIRYYYIMVFCIYLISLAHLMHNVINGFAQTAQNPLVTDNIFSHIFSLCCTQCNKWICSNGAKPARNGWFFFLISLAYVVRNVINNFAHTTQNPLVTGETCVRSHTSLPTSNGW